MKTRYLIMAAAVILAASIAIVALADRGGGQGRGQQGARMEQRVDRGSPARMDETRARQELSKQERKRVEADGNAQGDQVRSREEKTLQERERLGADGTAVEVPARHREQTTEREREMEDDD